jgi:hypothetical protein
MADQIAPNRTQTRRVSRSSTSKVKRGTGAKGKNIRAQGLKLVDTIPRLEPDEDQDAESRGLTRLLGEESEEGFTQGTFADDLQRTLAFVEALPPDVFSGKHSDLYVECSRILHDEVDRAREIATLRKAVPRA